MGMWVACGEEMVVGGGRESSGDDFREQWHLFVD